MNIIMVKGGLGNQLFQVSYAFYLSRHSSARVWLLTGLLNRYAVKRDFYFHQLPPNIRVNSSYLLALLCRIAGFLLHPFFRRRIFLESSKGYSPAHHLSTAVFIDAYLQNFNHPPYFDFLFNDPTYRNFLSNNLDAHFKEANAFATHRDCLHIRGGDMKVFFSPAQVQADVDMLYRQLMALQPTQNLIVVTDDVPYAQSFFKAGDPVSYQSAHWTIDFLTLAHARHLGMIESTFTMWAAIYGYIRYRRLRLFTSRHCLEKYPVLAYMQQHQAAGLAQDPAQNSVSQQARQKEET